MELGILPANVIEQFVSTSKRFRAKEKKDVKGINGYDARNRSGKVDIDF